MRALTYAFAAALLAVQGGACGGGSSSTAHDMATVKKVDFSTSGDLTAAGVGCDAYVKCLNNCPDSGSAHDSCFAACDAEVSKSGKQLFNDILVCAQGACDAMPDTSPDMGSPCRYDPSTNQFDDPTACGACQSQQLQAGTCTSQQSACSNDTTGE